MTKNHQIALGSILSSSAVVLGSGIYLLFSASAVATPKYGAATGQSCSACHVRPDGGPDLTDFGKKFQSNGDKLEMPAKVPALK